MNNNLILFKKVWNFKDGAYGEKDYWFNPAVEVRGMEECKVKDNSGKELSCVKIYYHEATKERDHFITLLGNLDYFIRTCRESNISICLLQDLYKEGLTIKKFLQQNERLNGIEFS